MIDFHSHILPGVDDGSRSIEESLQLIEMLKNQGVTKVFATSHYYPSRESIDSFLQRRSEAYEKLAPHLPADSPEIILGAEVKYAFGICNWEKLRKLSVGKNDLLLVEMPMDRWTDYSVTEVCRLVESGGYTVVLAHIERYMQYQSRQTVDKLYNSGVLMQCNAHDFVRGFKKRKMLSDLANGKIHLLGSDCHNTVNRPPLIGEAFAAIEKKFGNRFLSDMDEFAVSLIQ